MSEAVLISLITISFNSAKHIEQTILSVLGDGYPNKEYVIVDGGSKDNTLNIINKYRTRINHVHSEPDDGISDAFNKGITLSHGEIIGIVSSDDYLLPGALESVATAYTQNGRPDVIYGNVKWIDVETGKQTISRPDPGLKSAFFGQPVKHGGTFVSRKAYEKYGLFNLKYKCAMDFDLILRMIVGGARFVYLDKELEVIRGGGVSEQRRELTRRESRDISIDHGCPRWKANGYYYWKWTKDIVKKLLIVSPLTPVLQIYRRLRGRNVPI